MDSHCERELTLVCISGETLKVSQNLIEETSHYISQVLMNTSSNVLLFPDVEYEDLKNLINKVESGKMCDENLSEIALKYGFKIENTEAHLPLKKRPLEHSPPSSPELVIDESYSPRNGSPSQRSDSPTSEASLTPYLPWPLLLQQVAMQRSLNEMEKSSDMTLNSSKSTLFDPIDTTKNLDNDEVISCEECGKTFRASNLRIHMRRVHRVLQKPVKCCGLEFPTRWHLTQHRKSGDHLPTLWKSENVN